MQEIAMVFETLKVHKEQAVLFAAIAAPPMNLLGPELVRDMVSLIQQTEADKTLRVVVFKSADPDYFISHVRGRIDTGETTFTSAADLARALRRAAAAHDEHEKRLGKSDPQGWPDWYAGHLVAEQAGKPLPTRAAAKEIGR